MATSTNETINLLENFRKNKKPYQTSAEKLLILQIVDKVFSHSLPYASIY